MVATNTRSIVNLSVLNIIWIFIFYTGWSVYHSLKCTRNLNQTSLILLNEIKILVGMHFTCMFKTHSIVFKIF